VAVADAGAISLASAIGIIHAVMVVVAAVAVAVSLRVPHGPSNDPGRSLMSTGAATVPMER
jgi:hypothetical protein